MRPEPALAMGECRGRAHSWQHPIAECLGWEPGQPPVSHVRKLWMTVIEALTAIRVGLVCIR